MAPFVRGGAEALVDNLIVHLRDAGHEPDVLRLPFYWEPYDQIPGEVFRFKSMKLDCADLVIPMKFPAYLIPAPRKRIWLMHQYRQAYDMWDAGTSNIPNTSEGRLVRDAIIAEDVAEFSRAGEVLTISQAVSDRLSHYCGVDSSPLRVPINDPELFLGGKNDGYIFAGGRINSSKRQHLLLEAMQYVAGNVRLIIAGPPDDMEDADRLRRLVLQLGLEDRVRLDLRFLPREKYAEYVNRSLAVAYLPHNEDAFGYVTVEAMQAKKPVLTVSDAGELLLLVRHLETGYVSEPTPRSVADGLSYLGSDPTRASLLGASAYDLWRELDTTWSSVIERLLQ